MTRTEIIVAGRSDYAVPARDSNPFASCWTRPGALPFLSTGNTSVERCLARLERAAWRGQILGPHGAGKSTLLAAVSAALSARGHVVRCVNGRECRSPAGLFSSEGAGERAPSAPRPPIALVDSFELLAPWRRARWRRAARRRFGLVVTSHSPARLPTLAVLRPRLAEVLQMFELLTSSRPTRVGEQAVAAAFDRHDGNVREVWFDLYDLHERLSR